MTTLLHTCCGPCACACVPALKEMDREVTMLFANSNIDTREEFDKRLHEAEKLAQADGVRLVALPYDHEEWLREVAAGYEHEPEKGDRCTRCFRYNLGKAAEYAAEHGFDEFTTSLTVSPHKDSKTIFEVARSIRRTPSPRSSSSASFLAADFKQHDGYVRSVKRATELGLYRQDYCGCEFSKERWNIHSKRVTESTNLDARAGVHRDVFTADFQTAGRGRLDHRWLSPQGENLMMSVVLSVADIRPEQVATFPLVAGLSVAKAAARLLPDGSPISLKWPNDVLAAGRKLAGILCERQGDNVIVGIGVNVAQKDFAPEIADRATSMALIAGRRSPTVKAVRSAVLAQLGKWYGVWKDKGFGAVHGEIAAIDCLKGRMLTVRQTDDDAAPIVGVCGGIKADGSLDVGGVSVYAGEAHVERMS